MTVTIVCECKEHITFESPSIGSVTCPQCGCVWSPLPQLFNSEGRCARVVQVGNYECGDDDNA